MTSTPPFQPPRELSTLFSSHRRTRPNRSRIPRMTYDDSEPAIGTVSSAAQTIPSNPLYGTITRPRSSTYHAPASSSSISDLIENTRRRRRSRLFNSISGSSGNYSYHFGPDEDSEPAPFSFQPPKKRKLEEYAIPQDGTKQLKLSVAHCDGGTYEKENYRVGNLLNDDEHVYCTEKYSCNIVLQHESQQPFTLERLEINAPPVGFTSPVSEGVIAVTDNDYYPVLDRISSYGRMVPLNRLRKRSNTTGARYGSLRGEDNEGDNWFIDPARDLGSLDGEMVTEFDVPSGLRTPGQAETNDEEDKDEDENEEEEGEGEQEGDDDGAEDMTDADEGEPQLVDDDSDTPVEVRSSTTPWPPFGSRSIPTTNYILPAEDDNTGGGSNTQIDCPFDFVGEEETEVEGERQQTENEDQQPRSAFQQLGSFQLRRLLSRHREVQRRRAREEEAEAEAEREYSCSEAEGDGDEAYMRFQIHDNKTLIMFNPPRYCKSVVLKLWGRRIDNVDIQSILGYGFFGMRVFPALEMR